MPVFCVYIAPPEDDPFYILGSSFLGYNARSNSQLPLLLEDQYSYANAAAIVGGATAFGFHCTVSDALEYEEKDRAIILDRVGKIAASCSPLTLENFTISDELWGVTSGIFGFFEEKTGAFRQLASQIVEAINPLYIGSPYFPSIIEVVPTYNADYYKKYGAPFVHDLYVPHFTFASGEMTNCERSEVVSHLSECPPFSSPESKVTINDVLVLEQSSTGIYQIIHKFELSGQTI